MKRSGTLPGRSSALPIHSGRPPSNVVVFVPSNGVHGLLSDRPWQGAMLSVVRGFPWPVKRYPALFDLFVVLLAPRSPDFEKFPSSQITP